MYVNGEGSIIIKNVAAKNVVKQSEVGIKYTVTYARTGFVDTSINKGLAGFCPLSIVKSKEEQNDRIYLSYRYSNSSETYTVNAFILEIPNTNVEIKLENGEYDLVIDKVTQMNTGMDFKRLLDYAYDYNNQTIRATSDGTTLTINKQTIYIPESTFLCADYYVDNTNFQAQIVIAIDRVIKVN